jgi:hypothetical protein
MMLKQQTPLQVAAVSKKHQHLPWWQALSRFLWCRLPCCLGKCPGQVLFLSCALFACFHAVVWRSADGLSPDLVAKGERKASASNWGQMDDDVEEAVVTVKHTLDADGKGITLKGKRAKSPIKLCTFGDFHIF